MTLLRVLCASASLRLKCAEIKLTFWSTPTGGHSPLKQAAKESFARRSDYSHRFYQENLRLKTCKHNPKLISLFLTSKNGMRIVYILKCSDGTYYVGCTDDMEDRLGKHNRGAVQFTSTRLPLKIAHQSIFFDKYKAYDFETYMKSGSGRAFAKKHF